MTDREKTLTEIREALRRVELGTYHITAFANLEYWLRFLLSELERKEKVIEYLIRDRDEYHRQRNEIYEAFRKVREERDDLIEGLLVYAEQLIGSDDDGEHARDILKELGVDVDGNFNKNRSQ